MNRCFDESLNDAHPMDDSSELSDCAARQLSALVLRKETESRFTFAQMSIVHQARFRISWNQTKLRSLTIQSKIVTAHRPSWSSRCASAVSQIIILIYKPQALRRVRRGASKAMTLCCKQFSSLWDWGTRGRQVGSPDFVDFLVSLHCQSGFDLSSHKQ